MKTTIKTKVAIPVTPNFVTTEDGQTYQLGGLTDAGIRYLGREMTAAMLATAKQQRAAKKQEKKP